MTYVRFLVNCEVDAIKYAEGQVVDFPYSLASAIVANGFGEEVSDNSVTQQHSARMQTDGDGEIGGPISTPEE
jgi:hypothetical protein